MQWKECLLWPANLWPPKAIRCWIWKQPTRSNSSHFSLLHDLYTFWPLLQGCFINSHIFTFFCCGFSCQLAELAATWHLGRAAMTAYPSPIPYSIPGQLLYQAHTSIITYIVMDLLCVCLLQPLLN